MHQKTWKIVNRLKVVKMKYGFLWVYCFWIRVKNNETIAAYLNELIRDDNKFCQGYYNSNQSRIYFQNLLTFLPKPRAFPEGFNDFKNNQTITINLQQKQLCQMIIVF